MENFKLEPSPLLVLENVHKEYPSPSGAEPAIVLRGVNLTASAGERLAIVGPSGCGKSTLLNIIGALDVPTSGDALIEGRSLASLDEQERARFRNRTIGFIFQSHHLLPQCSALENVLVPALVHESPIYSSTRERAQRLLDRVGLGHRVTHRPGQLSGGERQRVAVVRSLINQPSIVLADEPTGSLDRRSADELSQLLLELNREEGVALIVVTHAMDLAKRMERVYELIDGRLAERGRES